MKIRSEKGFSLVEVIVVTGMSMAFFLIIYQVSGTLTNFWHQNLAQAEANAVIRKAMYSVVRELKCARTSSVTISGSQNDNSITFQIPYQSCDAGNNNCTWLYGADQVQGASITYLLNGRNLTRQVKDSSSAVISQEVIASNVSALNFSLATNDAFIQDASGSGYLNLNTSTSKPKTYNVQITYENSSVTKRNFSTNLSSRVTVQNV